jgi:hypothetical protein
MPRGHGQTMPAFEPEFSTGVDATESRNFPRASDDVRRPAVLKSDHILLVHLGEENQ